MNWTAIGIVGGFIIQTVVVAAFVSGTLAGFRSDIANLIKSIDELKTTMREHSISFVTKEEWDRQIKTRDQDFYGISKSLRELAEKFNQCQLSHAREK